MPLSLSFFSWALIFILRLLFPLVKSLVTICFKVGYKCLRCTLIKIYAKYSSGGTRLCWRKWNKSRNRRNKQRKHEQVLHFYCWPKTGKYKTYNKIWEANLVQTLWKEERVEGSKRRIYLHCSTFVKEKNNVVYKPSTLTYFQRSVQRHLNPKGSMGNLQKEDDFAFLNFLERF